MALAGASAGYAWWSDTLYLRSTITTGTFGAYWVVDCCEFSHFLKWNPDSQYYNNGEGEYETNGDPKGIEDTDYWVIATGDYKLEDCEGYGACTNCRCDILWINLTNVFPSADLFLQGRIVYYGTVPGHLVEAEDTADLTLNVGENDQQLFEDVSWSDIPWLFVEVKILTDSTDDLVDQLYGIDENGIYPWVTVVDELECTQWHEDWELVFVIYIHFIQWDMIFQDHWDRWFDCDAALGSGAGTEGDPYGLGLSVGDDVPQNAKLEIEAFLDFEQWNYS